MNCVDREDVVGRLGSGKEYDQNILYEKFEKQ